MIRRLKRYKKVLDFTPCLIYPESQTSQLEPSLHELLVKYSHGEDISSYISSAPQATAEMQFQNRIGKVDYLTEMETYVKKEVSKAKKLVDIDKTTHEQSKAVETPKKDVIDEK